MWISAYSAGELFRTRTAIIYTRIPNDNDFGRGTDAIDAELRCKSSMDSWVELLNRSHKYGVLASSRKHLAFHGMNLQVW